MNYQNNRVHTTLGKEKLEAILAQIRALEESFPQLTPLTSKERAHMQTISGSNKLFVEDATELMAGKPELLPKFLEAKDVQLDYQLFQELDQICQAMEILFSKISDTRFLAGAEAFNGALMFYQSVKFATRAAVPGAKPVYEQLKGRFKFQASNSKPSGAETEFTENPDLA